MGHLCDSFLEIDCKKIESNIFRYTRWFMIRKQYITSKELPSVISSFYIKTVYVGRRIICYVSMHSVLWAFVLSQQCCRYTARVHSWLFACIFDRHIVFSVHTPSLLMHDITVLLMRLTTTVYRIQYEANVQSYCVNVANTSYTITTALQCIRLHSKSPAKALR